MTSFGSDSVLAVFVLFCRIGACLMLIPGLGSSMIPARIRLFGAFAATLILAPMLLEPVRSVLAQGGSDTVLVVAFTETMTGLLIGLVVRLVFAAIEFAAAAAALMFGLGSIPGVVLEGNQPVPAIGALVTLSAVTLFFVLDLHVQVLRALADSYAAFPPAALRAFEMSMDLIKGALHDMTVLAIRLLAPFAIYGLVVNAAVGLTNKLSPQVPVFFISLPFVMIGGLLLLYFTTDNMMAAFTGAMAQRLAGG